MASDVLDMVATAGDNAPSTTAIPVKSDAQLSRDEEAKAFLKDLEKTVDQNKRRREKEAQQTDETGRPRNRFDDEADKIAKEAADPDAASDESGESTEAAKATKVTKPNESEQEQYSDELIERAAEWEISESEAKSYGSPKILELALNKLDQKLGRLASKQSATTEQTKPAQKPDTPASAEPSKPSGADQFSLDIADPEKLSPTDYDPEVIRTVKAVRALESHLKERVAHLEKTIRDNLGPIQHRIAQQDAIADMAEFDTIVSDLGEEFSPLFGNGDSAKLKRDSTEWKNRAKLYREESILVDVYRTRNGGKIPPRPVVLRRAASLLKDELTPAAASTQPTPKRPATNAEQPRSKENGQFVERPSQRQTIEQRSARDRGADEIERYLKSRGVDLA